MSAEATLACRELERALIDVSARLRRLIEMWPSPEPNDQVPPQLYLVVDNDRRAA